MNEWNGMDRDRGKFGGSKQAKPKRGRVTVVKVRLMCEMRTSCLRRAVID